MYVRMCTGGGHGKLERPGWGRFGGSSVGMCVSRVPPMISACAAVGCRVCHRYCHHVAILGTKGRSKTNPFVHMEVRGCSLQKTSTSRKHADSKQRRLAAVAPQKGDGISSFGAPSAHCREPGRVSRTRRASLQQGRTEGILCLADTEVNQKPHRTPPRVCRQTFGAFARDMAHIIPSRGPQLAGSSGSVPSENPGGAWNPEPASPT